MSNITAILAIVNFCAVGPVNIDKCDDGSKPIQYSVNILNGESDYKCNGFNAYNYSIMNNRSCYKSLDSVIEINEGDKLIFRLKPDGSTDTALNYNPDLAAKAFWFAVFGAYGPAAKIWNKE